MRASPLVWPLPPALVLVPAGLILTLTLAGTWSQLSWRALDWVYLSGQVGAQARLPVVVAAGAAALAAARYTRPDLVFAQPWQPRMERDVPLRHAVVVTGWCLGAYLAGLLPLTAAVAARGAGTPDPLAVLGALAGFVALTLLGYLCGVLLRGLLAVPVAVAAVFVLTSLPLVADSWTALSLQLPFAPSLGLRENTALGAYRLGFFLLLTTAAALTAAWLLRAPRRVSATHAVAAGAAAVAVALPHLSPFPLVAYAGDGREVCAEHGGVRYCVHEGHVDELGPIVDLAAPVFAAHGSADAAPDQVRDHSLATGDREVLDGPGHGVLWVRVHPGWDPYQQVPEATAAWLVPGPEVCGSDGVARLDEDAEPEERRAAVLVGLRAWLASRAHATGDDATADTARATADDPGTGTPDDAAATPDGDPFGGADPDEVRTWIDRDGERLAKCDVAPEELPWWP
jgi:hypothetical protein